MSASNTGRPLRSDGFVVSADTLTLFIGGRPRDGAAHRQVPADERDAIISCLYPEVVLSVPLAQLPDAWCTLRAIWHWTSPSGVVTVWPGAELRRVDAENLLLLAGFKPFLSEQTPAGVRIRGRRMDRSLRRASCTVVVPCKNEVGNVADVVKRTPQLGTHSELVFVDGDSNDGTPERIQALIDDHPNRDIKLYSQGGGGGKAAAVRVGFDRAIGDVVMILDADMTVAPEDLPRFYLALAEGVTDFANGTRFAYPMEAGAMRPLNRAGNRLFGVFLSWLLGTAIGDSLCGTKALFRRDWQRVAAARPLFGGHDPWGDFDLLLGAAYCGLRLFDVPVRYHARTAGQSKMQPVRHGFALVRTCGAGAYRLKLRGRAPVRSR